MTTTRAEEVGKGGRTPLGNRPGGPPLRDRLWRAAVVLGLAHSSRPEDVAAIAAGKAASARFAAATKDTAAKTGVTAAAVARNAVDKGVPATVKAAKVVAHGASVAGTKTATAAKVTAEKAGPATATAARTVAEAGNAAGSAANRARTAVEDRAQQHQQQRKLAREQSARPLWQSGVLWFGRLGGLLTGTVAGALVLFLVVSSISPHVASGVANVVSVQLDVPDEAALPQLGERSVVYAADGSVLAVLHDEIYRRIVPLDTVPEHVQQAIIAAEDRKFWEHPGYDVEGIARAALANAEAGEITQGGSTITQQLAKTEVGDEDTYERKINELLYAVALEEEFTKPELLERYLNQVYFGAGAYGIAAAAEEFFGIDQSQLTVPQAALLAGLIRSPGATDPRTNTELATSRRDAVLAGMVEMGVLDAGQLSGFQAQPVEVIPHREREPIQPHFVDAVIQEFVGNPVFGATEQDRFELLYSGGLQIRSTLDPRIQTIATEVLAEQFTNAEGPTGAIAAVDPRNGRVLAVEGGVSYEDEQYNLAVQARRQPGSAFKPFVYATALQQGFPLTMSLEGSSPAYFEGICGWARENPPGCGADDDSRGVRNYGGSSYGRMSMREALINSVNTAAAQLMIIVGAENVANTAAAMGIDVEEAIGPDANPAIALGGLLRGVTPLEMASAYGTFGNGGAHIEPYVIDSVLDRNGEVLFANAPQGGEQVLAPEVNAAMVDIMQGVVTSGTGTRARLNDWRVAGKTGTTQNSADAWFVGYTPVISTAVWMGHKDELVPMRGVTGGGTPAGLWREFMSRALEGFNHVAFPEVDYGERRVVEGDPVVVPDVRRLDETEALKDLANVRLIGDVVQVSSGSEEGTVVWQSPDPGDQAQTGDEVTIGVSTGRAAPPAPAPDNDPVPDSTEPSDADGEDSDSGEGDDGEDGSTGGEGEGEGEGDGSADDGGGEGEAPPEEGLPTPDAPASEAPA